MLYKGSCHCGKIAFEVEGEINAAVACNCSICSRKGSLLWFVPREKLQLKTRACQFFCVKRGHEIIPKGMFHDRRNDYQEA